MSTKDTQGEAIPDSHSKLHPCFAPLSEQDRQAFTPDNPDTARIAFLEEAAVIVTENSISVCLNNGAEFLLRLPSFFTVVVTANAIVPLLLNPQIGIYTLLHSTGFQTIHASNDETQNTIKKINLINDAFAPQSDESIEQSF